MYIIIGTTIDREVIWSSEKDGDSMIVAHDGMLTFGYISLRQASVHNPYFLHFILYLCIKFQGVE
jgi:hypothetical protein